MSVVTFRLRERGSVFSTRPQGREVLHELLELAEEADTVVVDLAEVRSLGYSFADEFLGALGQGIANGKHDFTCRLVNVPGPIDRVIRGSFDRRGVEGEAWLLQPHSPARGRNARSFGAPG